MIECISELYWFELAIPSSFEHILIFDTFYQLLQNIHEKLNNFSK